MSRKRKPQSQAAAPAEISAQVVSATQAAVEPKIDFDSWFALRGPKIPPQHHKEIIKADFKGRKVPVWATIAEFDEALRKYGVKLD